VLIGVLSFAETYTEQSKRIRKLIFLLAFDPVRIQLSVRQG